MKVLTVRQPWAHAIINLGKDVENRVWRTHYRGPLLIHAAAQRPSNPREMLAEYMRRPPSEENLRNLPLGAIVGAVELWNCIENSDSRWADEGEWHWLVQSPRPIKPIECTGRLGLWTLSDRLMCQLPKWTSVLDLKNGRKA